MVMTGPLVLPDDVQLVPVRDLPTHIRDRVECGDDDYAITRSGSRRPTSIVDVYAAALLQEFQTAKTILEAVLSYSLAHKTDPERVLDDAFPMLERFIRARLLVPESSREHQRIAPSFDRGDRVAGYEVLHCIQVLEDTELYQVRQERGGEAALKILRPGCGRELQQMMAREAVILERLGGRFSPRLFEAGTVDGRPYLAIEWCPGVHANVSAEEWRRLPGVEGRRKALELCCAILDAYAHLHARRVIHGDVHPRNVLVIGDGSVRIIDYGYARLADDSGEFGRAPRGGVAFFIEPEYAWAGLAGQRPPASSLLGEQYALGALSYFLLTGAHYLDFSLEQQAMLRQIHEDRPRPFADLGIDSWPEVEAHLARALSKDPADRFPSVVEFARRLRAAANAAEPDTSSLPRSAAPPAPAAEAMLNEVLRRVNFESPLLASGVTTPPICSVNFGAAGIAYALYRIACIRGDSALLSLADIWATKAARDCGSDRAFYNEELEITPARVGRVSPYHTASGVHCVQALIAQAMGDLMSYQTAVEAFAAALQAPCDNLDLTLGRSGLMLACALLLDAMPHGDPRSGNLLRELGNRTMQGIWDEINAFPMIRVCREMTYLGIAHGWAGVLYATMRWCQASGGNLPVSVGERLTQLADCAEHSGRGAHWPWVLEKHHRGPQFSYMPGWCNGSAGYVYLWLMAHRRFRDPEYLALAEQAAWNSWEEPASAGGLCCGDAGRAYGLLHFYKHTSDRTWLLRARELADRAASGPRVQELPPHSLYKGDVGVAVLASDLASPEGSCMPFFEQEGWPGR